MPLEGDSPQLHALFPALPAEDALVKDIKRRRSEEVRAATRGTELLLCEEEGASGLAAVFPFEGMVASASVAAFATQDSPRAGESPPVRPPRTKNDEAAAVDFGFPSASLTT